VTEERRCLVGRTLREPGGVDVEREQQPPRWLQRPTQLGTGAATLVDTEVDHGVQGDCAGPLAGIRLQIARRGNFEGEMGPVLPRHLDHLRSEVDADDVGVALGEERRDVARSAAHVRDAAGANQLDEAVEHRSVEWLALELVTTRRVVVPRGCVVCGTSLSRTSIRPGDSESTAGESTRSRDPRSTAR